MVVLASCGGGGQDSASASASGEGGSANDASSIGADASATGGSGSADASAGSSGGAATGTTTAASTTAVDSSGEGTIFDLAVTDDVFTRRCTGMGRLEFSYIWVANSSEGTISKINTETMIEEGRYRVRADSAGNPSRTSVNLSGDVAVANRAGGVTKVYARSGDCVESNGMPGIQTSTGALDILPWGTEECVAWFTDIVAESNRPVAWAPGVVDPVTCEVTGEKLWTSASSPTMPGSLHVYRLDGVTGTIEDDVPIPEVALGSWGAYGGAVDGDGNFWFTTHGTAMPNASITRVDAVTLDYEIWPTPAELAPYGFTVDADGRPWVAGYAGSVSRFDPTTETWDVMPGMVQGFGIQQDAMGRMWLAAYYASAAIAIDADTMMQVDSVAMPAGILKGCSIDFFGNVWIVYQYGSAWRIDPDTHDMVSYDGLVGAYTYSDMTGWGLSNVAFPPG
jgi:hypothetical protein